MFTGYVTNLEVLQEGVIVSSAKKTKLVKVGNQITEVVAKNMILNIGRDKFADATLPNLMSYAARGTSSTAANVSQKYLGRQIGARTNAYVAGGGSEAEAKCGTRYDRSTGTMYFRRTYDFEIETEEVAVNELGFGPNQAAPDHADNDTYALLSRVVLENTKRVQPGQQLRTTYEVAIQISPITPTVSAPTLTGIASTGLSRLVGFMPDSPSTYISAGNAFLNSIRTDGSEVGASYGGTDSEGEWAGILGYDKNWLNPGGMLDPSNTKSQLIIGKIAHPTMKSFGKWDYAFKTPYYEYCYVSTCPWYTSPKWNVLVAGDWTSSPSTLGTNTSTMKAYTSGNFYREAEIVMQPNWPDGAELGIHFVHCRGLTHTFNEAATKSTLERLTFDFRISW